MVCSLAATKPRTSDWKPSYCWGIYSFLRTKESWFLIFGNRSSPYQYLSSCATHFLSFHPSYEDSLALLCKFMSQWDVEFNTHMCGEWESAAPFWPTTVKCPTDHWWIAPLNVQFPQNGDDISHRHLALFGSMRKGFFAILVQSFSVIVTVGTREIFHKSECHNNRWFLSTPGFGYMVFRYMVFFALFRLCGKWSIKF